MFHRLFLANRSHLAECCYTKRRYHTRHAQQNAPCWQLKQQPVLQVMSPACCRCLCRPALCCCISLLALLLLLSISRTSAKIDPRPGSGDWSSSGGSSSSSRARAGGKHSKQAVVGPEQGFTGGSVLDNNHVAWCNSPSLPGCQTCPDGNTCTACWSEHPGAVGSRFVLNPATGQCDCPGGYGLLPKLPPPTWPPPTRHLMSQLPAIPTDVLPTAAAEPAAAAASNTTNDALASTLQASEAANNPAAAVAVLQGVAGSLTPPTPRWASSCMACPVNYFSAGGQQGFAQCRACPGSYTTAGATAATTCLFPFCGPGQEPSRTTGRCRPCPIGSYSSASANNQLCYPCPKGTTTAAAGSRTFTECRVPICAAGQELDLDLFVCYNCKGNSMSVGGKRFQGTAQPRCMECPFGSAANAARTECRQGACPYPDNFAITCRTPERLANVTCGPGNKPISISQLCTAYPPGSQLSYFQEDSTPREEIRCPVGAWASTSKLPVITSYNGRTDCVCSTSSGVSCAFANGQQNVRYPGGTASGTVSTLSLSVALIDPQADSLQALVQSMAGSYGTTRFLALQAGYCTVWGAFNNPLQVDCTGPDSYITSISLNPVLLSGQIWPGDGVLPSAARLRGLSQLQALVCSSCGMDGTLPRDWGTESSLMELKTLDLRGNSFTGTLPETWGYMVNLASLTLSSTSAGMGKIPSAWGLMRSLVFVNLTGASLDNTVGSCAPWQWRVVNRLIANETFWPPANYPTLPFCDQP